MKSGPKFSRQDMLYISISTAVVLIMVSIIFAFFSEFLLGKKWRTFDSTGSYTSRYHPHFTLRHPFLWNSSTAEGIIVNKGCEEHIWAKFADSTYREISIYWRPSEKPSIDDAVLWGQEIIMRNNGRNISQLEETKIGIESYPAYTQTFQAHRTYKLVYVLEEASEYILLFNAKSFDNETEAIFNQILDSFRLLPVPYRVPVDVQKTTCNSL